MPTWTKRQVLLRQLGAHFHLAALGEAEQAAGARADDLADLDVARQDQAAVGARMLSRPICARVAFELGLGDPDARDGGVARGVLAVEVGLGDEAAADQRRARSNSFWASAASARATWIWAASCAAVCAWTERSIDREHLAGADPAAGIDEHARRPGRLRRRRRPAGRAARRARRTRSRPARPGCGRERRR